MNELKQALKLMQKETLSCLKQDTKFYPLTHIKKIENELEIKAADKIKIQPSSITLTAILNKMLNGVDLKRSEIRNIPFILYDGACVKKIFFKCIQLLDAKKTSHMRRLFYVYLSQYDDSKKTEIIAKILQNVFSKNLIKTKNKFLQGAKEHHLFFFSDRRMSLMSNLIHASGNLRNVMVKLDLPSTLQDCNFLAKSLQIYFLHDNYMLEGQYQLFKEIKEKGIFSSLYPLTADCLIPKIDSSTSINKMKYKKLALDDFYYLLGDPRFGVKTVKWNTVSDHARKIFLHWLAESDLNLFFKIIEETAVDDMWSYRKSFWQRYLPFITNTWVFFGKEAIKYVGRLTGTHMNYGQLGKGCLANQSVFAFKLGKFVFVEWSHNGKLRVWMEEDAPDVFGNRLLHKDSIVNSFPLQEWIHAGKNTNHWQNNVSWWISQNCNLR